MGMKDQILLLLKENRGNWVSGESVSEKMAISRSAIWKHVRKLKGEGYLIESSPKKGYLLRESPSALLPGEIQDGLETAFLGRRGIIYFEEVCSTNQKAKELAAEGAPQGTLVICEKQTEGRGRRGRYWFSPWQEGIYLSFILRPNISPIETSKITLLTAVAVAETLLSLTRLSVVLKWPNDILVKGKKVAGILAEISTDMDVVNYVVIGLGLNVNTSEFPEDIRARATSIFMETGERFSRIRILQECLRVFESYYEMFERRAFAPVLDRYRELSDMVGRRGLVETIDGSYTGTVEGIDADGVLLFSDGEGERRRVLSGDLNFI